MPAQDAVIVLGLDLSLTIDRDRGAAFLDGNQSHMIVVRVVMLGLDLAAVDTSCQWWIVCPAPSLGRSFSRWSA